MKKFLFMMAIPAMIAIVSCGSKPEAKSLEKSDPATASADKHDNSSRVIHLTKADFLVRVMNYEENPQEWKFQGERPCMIDFYADWCGPCRTTSPIIEELAKEYAGKVDFYKIDTDKESELASVFGIQGIPSFLYCPKEGKPVMNSGIAQTVEETRKMFVQQIESTLLN
jgi:thioredoxin 1